MKPLKPCKSYDAGDYHCRDGFPQVSAVCWGGDGGAPVCCNEELCGRLYEHSGGKPPAIFVKNTANASSTALLTRGE